MPPFVLVALEDPYQAEVCAESIHGDAGEQLDQHELVPWVIIIIIINVDRRVAQCGQRLTGPMWPDVRSTLCGDYA